jgi:cation diffusion facilitator family transporter
MHSEPTDLPEHDHVYLGEHHDRNARRTWWVVGLTLAMMIGEIAAGTLFGSMALLADGWHMATHAGALGIAGLAYAYARRHARNARFSFGTGKVGDLAGFASALIMAVAAVLIAVESVQRVFLPVTIEFIDAIAVAVLGLAVNLVSAMLLDSGRGHDHDHNLRAAYLHVLADAVTSIAAIAALVLGRWLGWAWLDPVIGLAGAMVIARWALGMMRDTGAVLLDAAGDPALARAVRAAIEVGDEKVNDLHLWRVGPGRHAAIVSLTTTVPLEPDAYKLRLAHLPQIVHVSVEPHCSISRNPAAPAPEGKVHS